MKSLLLFLHVCFSFMAFPQSAHDEKKVRAIIQNMEDAYNAHDYSFSGKYDVFTDDAVFINPVGMYWKSRPEIISGIQALGPIRLKYETAKYIVKDIRFLAPAVVFVVVYSAGKVEQDYMLPDGTKGGTTGEATYGMYSLTLVKQKGTWKVSSMQITHIVPKAATQIL